jgi:hypothetical protein
MTRSIRLGKLRIGPSVFDDGAPWKDAQCPCQPCHRVPRYPCAFCHLSYCYLHRRNHPCPQKDSQEVDGKK